MKNIFVLPTDKPSRLFLNKVNNKLLLEDISNPSLKKVLPSGSYQNIYITSDEKFEEGWFGYVFKEDVETDKVFIYTHSVYNTIEWYKNVKKIILTTDQDLIADGVQSIDEKFLQWFVKNSDCEFVEIEYQTIGLKDGIWQYDYKIIILQEEPLPDVNWQSEIINKVWDEEEPKQETNFYEKLKEYFRTITREKVLEDWNKSAEFDKVGCTIDEFIENSNKERLKENGEKWSLNSAKEFALSYFKKSDEVSSKGMFTYELLLRILEAGIECGYKFGIKRQDEKRYTYDELRQIAYNAYCLGQLEEPTENKYNLWIQQFKNK
jgi:hypothetical protein